MRKIELCSAKNKKKKQPVMFTVIIHSTFKVGSNDAQNFLSVHFDLAHFEKEKKWNEQ